MYWKRASRNVSEKLGICTELLSEKTERLQLISLEANLEIDSITLNSRTESPGFDSIRKCIQ